MCISMVQICSIGSAYNRCPKFGTFRIVRKFSRSPRHISKSSGLFLSDPSPIIVYPCHSLTNSLTDCRLADFIDVTLACEDGNSKLVEVVTVANVDDEDCAGNSLLQIWELMFGHKAKLLFRP